MTARVLRKSRGCGSGQRASGCKAELRAWSRFRPGRLLLPMHGGTGEQGTQHNIARAYFSDDEGKTWTAGRGTVDLPMRGAMEPSVTELEIGRLMMSLRTQLGSVFLSQSDDHGDTWTLAQPAGLKAPESCTCLRRIPGTNDLILFWNDSQYNPKHHHFGERSPLSRRSDVKMKARLGCAWAIWSQAIASSRIFPVRFLVDRKSGGHFYMQSTPPFSRTAIDLCVAVIEKAWFGLKKGATEPHKAAMAVSSAIPAVEIPRTPFRDRWGRRFACLGTAGESPAPPP